MIGWMIGCWNTWISGSATTNCFNILLPKARDIANTPPTLQVPDKTRQYNEIKLRIIVMTLSKAENEQEL